VRGSFGAAIAELLLPLVLTNLKNMFNDGRICLSAVYRGRSTHPGSIVHLSDNPVDVNRVSIALPSLVASESASAPTHQSTIPGLNGQRVRDGRIGLRIQIQFEWRLQGTL